MEPWSSGAWVVYMSLAMGVGAFLISKVIHLWWAGAQTPKQLAEWVEQLDRASRDLHTAEIHRAVCYRKVADLIGRIPEDFDPVAIADMRVSNAMGRAILSKTEQLGMYPEGTFESLGVTPIKLPEPEPELAPPAANNGNGARPWMGRFVQGRLVPDSEPAHHAEAN